jgi:hypothetical protein
MVTCSYDAPSDTLHLDTCDPYAAQESNEIQPGIVARFNPDNGKPPNTQLASTAPRSKKTSVSEAFGRSFASSLVRMSDRILRYEAHLHRIDVSPARSGGPSGEAPR